MLAILVLATAVPLAGQSHSVLASANWRQLPPFALAIPLVGFLLAPVYPVLYSSVLSGLPQDRHAPMTGLILVSSALGGTIGSFVTGHIFAAIDGRAAFLAILVPLALLLIAMIVFDRSLRGAYAIATQRAP